MMRSSIDDGIENRRCHHHLTTQDHAIICMTQLIVDCYVDDAIIYRWWHRQ